MKNKILVLSLFTVFSFSASLLSASSEKEDFSDGKKMGLNTKMCKKGKKVFRKKLRKFCGFTGAKFASMHTIKEWGDIEKKDSFDDELHKLCPKIKGVELKESWKKGLLQFSKCFASDSGNYAPC